ncbi:unnamed protein product, partial [Polarella glacialis]
VLRNLRQFSNANQFFSICVASVARQLDHRSLRDVHKVFSELDANGDGVLELSEVKEGFERIYGRESEQYQDVERMFSRLDLDGSGSIDYTEFCAAGIGERMCLEETTLWAAFKAFDVQDDDGRITKDEIKQVLASGDVKQLWTTEVCQEVTEEIFDLFDANGDGALDFTEFMGLMRECASRHKDPGSVDELEQELAVLKEENLDFKKAYGMLTRLDDIDRNSGGGSTPSASSKQRLLDASGADTIPGIVSDSASQPSMPERANTLSMALRQLSYNFAPRVEGSRNGTPQCFSCTSGVGASMQQCTLM